MADLNLTGVEYKLPSPTARLVMKRAEELGINLKLHQGQADFSALYQRGQKMGSGGFGNVFRGIRLEDGRSVVLKEIDGTKVPCWCALDAMVLPMEMVLLEICQGLPGIVQVMDLFKIDSTWTIVMDGVPDSVCDLFDHICARGKLSEDEAAYCLYQLIGILLRCHEVGLLHRDIKDENLLVDRNTLEVTLIDFGSGAFLHDGLYTDFDGTRVYCPPEWITQNKYYGKQAEVWSLGILLYDMLCGDVPFTNDNGIVNGRLKFRKDGLDDDAKHLMSWCLNRDSLRRPNLLEILRHPWMQRRRPQLSSSLPFSAMFAIEKLMTNSAVNFEKVKFMAEITDMQINRLYYKSSKAIEGLCKTRFCEDESLTDDVFRNEIRTLDGTICVKCFPDLSKNFCDSHVNERNRDTFSELPTNHQFQHQKSNLIKDDNSTSRKPSDRSYASSGYFSRSNSLSSDEGRKRSVLAASKTTENVFKPFRPSCSVSDHRRCWRGYLVTNSISSNLCLSTSVSTYDLHPRTVPAICQTLPQMIMPASSPLHFADSFHASNALSCTNLRTLCSSKVSDINSLMDLEKAPDTIVSNVTDVVETSVYPHFF